MTKNDFLNELKEKLQCLPKKDIEERLSFYAELIDDRTEDGEEEDAVIRDIGHPEEIAAQIVTDTPFSTLIKERIRPKRKLAVWETVLLVLGFPLWFALLTGAAAVVFSIYVLLWSLIICLWSVFAAFAAGAAGGIAAIAVCPESGAGLFYAAAALFCAGMAILMFFACIKASKGALHLTKKTTGVIKNLFVKKETAK